MHRHLLREQHQRHERLRTARRQPRRPSALAWSPRTRGKLPGQGCNRDTRGGGERGALPRFLLALALGASAPFGARGGRPGSFQRGAASGMRRARGAHLPGLTPGFELRGGGSGGTGGGGGRALRCQEGAAPGLRRGRAPDQNLALPRAPLPHMLHAHHPHRGRLSREPQRADVPQRVARSHRAPPPSRIRPAPRAPRGARCTKHTGYT
mmetsp:Transcript_20906/g.47146  ORF Transcript_20906/g.47146 Transcript_20906/m.47146 type:complete len:209 (+) Transcript_20906:731-1357(+)